MQNRILKIRFKHLTAKDARPPTAGEQSLMFIENSGNEIASPPASVRNDVDEGLLMRLETNRLVSFLLFALILLGCQQRKPDATEQVFSLVDDLGETVQLHHKPERIVSLAPSITETLFALGLDSEIVGVTEFCDIPEAAKQKPKVGGILNPNIERVVELKPDVVILSTSGNLRTDYDMLKGLGIPVFVTNPNDINGTFKSISDLGKLTYRQATADSLVASLQQEKQDLLQSIKNKSPKKVLMLLSLKPIVAVGKGAFLHELITLANGENIAGNSTILYPLLSREEIFQRAPDVILATHDVAESIEDITSVYPEWKSLPAVHSKRVVFLDAGLVTRPGPRIIEALKTIIRAIHSQL